MASPPPLAASETRCGTCGATSTGKFCSNCGAPFAGATCSACGTPLSPGAKFCHRCGTPAGAAGRTDVRSFSGALPWAVAAIALVALIALVAGQRFARSRAGADQAAADVPSAPDGGATGAVDRNPPDISNLSPADAAIRLYNRVMSMHERGRADSVQLFAPMAIAAYEMIGRLDLDQRYDLGRIAAVSGDETRARAEADTILSQQPKHLLGLILAASAARMRKDAAAERTYRNRLVAAAPAERAKQLPEYTTHANDITGALAAKQP
jgi:Double zinc ribbon